MAYKKYEILVDNELFKLDGMWWDYPQTDADSSGATDENLFYRDVLPRRMKFGGIFQIPDEATASRVLQMRAKDSCEVEFFDLETLARVTRTMYPVCDAVKAQVLLDENGIEKFICEDVEVRFTQMIPDELAGGN